MMLTHTHTVAARAHSSHTLYAHSTHTLGSMHTRSSSAARTITSAYTHQRTHMLFSGSVDEGKKKDFMQKCCLQIVAFV